MRWLIVTETRFKAVLLCITTFTYATVLSDTHMCDTEQLLGNRNENMK